MVVIAFFLFLLTDSGLGGSFLGLALVFDPFDQAVPLHERPRWQVALLIGQVLCVFGMIGWDIYH